MNKPAAKEPSMDEILSSIRQIIADDDAGMSAGSAADEADDADDGVMSNDALDALHSFDVSDVEEAEDEALELSLDQVVDEDSQDEQMSALDEIEMPPMAALAAESEPDDDEDEAGIVVPDDISFSADAIAPKPKSSHSLPDPKLSADMAEQLLEPAAGAAVKNAFSKLSALSLGSGSVTIENMVREMLRPMLKEWLDENLPGVVEKMVEKEIERLSRGG